MLIGDGVTPGNEARGYVLRRLLRRAIRSMRLLGVDVPVLPVLLPVSLDRMKSSYPELERDFARISDIAYAEEEAFASTLKSGTAIFDLAVTSTKAAGGSTLTGDRAFALHDTYGFPIDLTLEMASEAGLTVDEQGFRRLMDEQRQRAKQDAKSKKHAHADLSVYRGLLDPGPTTFVGYERLETDASVRGLLVDGELVEVVPPGQRAEVVLDTTSFYAESGGQIADEGIITGDGVTLRVRDVQHPVKGLVVHTVDVEDGELRRCRRPGARRRTVAHLGVPGALRHPRRARGAAAGARSDRAAERLVQQAGLPAAGLRLVEGSGRQRALGARGCRGTSRCAPTSRCRRSS